VDGSRLTCTKTKRVGWRLSNARTRFGGLGGVTSPYLLRNKGFLGVSKNFLPCSRNIIVRKGKVGFSVPGKLPYLAVGIRVSEIQGHAGYVLQIKKLCKEKKREVDPNLEG